MYMEYLEAFTSLIKIFVPLLIITFTSIIIIKLIKIEDFLEKIILIFVFNWIQIIFSIELLSIFKKVNTVFVFSLNLIFFIIAIIILYLKKVKFNISFRNIILKVFYFFKFYNNNRTNSVLKIIIIVWLIVILLTTFFIGVSVPPKNNDSLIGYLVRVGIWKQQQSIDHYYTPMISQLENHINPGLGLLWILLFTNSSNILFLAQWVSLIIIMLIIYKILRYLKFNFLICLLSVFIFTISNIVILEAFTTQNDLIVTSFLLIAFYFLLKTLDRLEIKYIDIIIFGLVFGIAIGSKFYVYFFIVGFSIFSVLYGRQDRKKLVKISYMILFVIIGFLSLSIYNFVQNYLSFNSFLGSKNTVDAVRIINPDIKTFISVFIRNVNSFYEFTNLDFSTFSRLLEKSTDYIHNIFKIDINSLNTSLMTFKYSIFYLNMDVSYFGIIAFFITMPAIIYNSILVLIIRKKSYYNECIRIYKTSIIISLIPISYFILYSLFFKWEIFSGRYYIIFIAILTVNLALFFYIISKILNKNKLFKAIITFFLVVGIFFSFITLFLNVDFKIIPNKRFYRIFTSSPSMFSENYENRAFNTDTVVMKPILKSIKSNLPCYAKLGICNNIGNNNYICILDFFYFGKNFEKTIQYIPANELLENNISNIFIKYKLDGLLLKTKSSYYNLGDNNNICIDSQRFLDNYFILFYLK